MNKRYYDGETKANPKEKRMIVRCVKEKMSISQSTIVNGNCPTKQSDSNRTSFSGHTRFNKEGASRRVKASR